ncbi:hypothetical protein TNIN_455801 [Trichonephila inaurata madagascariensis]|uniref:Uncharacterized protein n=1 Tax=Trichonephila inaurata madagascariensis TaxID=2747483 RepID=A0A8X6YRE0_9ARAC|nr:hypothetical protein TNIN_455801 [Trichonephila inaurata madagascariensis]
MNNTNMAKMDNTASRSDSNLRFEKDISYPHTLSALKKEMLQECIKPTRRARRENPARYRTQPITFNEIKEVDEEKFATFQKEDLGKEPSSSNAGSHPERSVPEPSSSNAGSHLERSVPEPSSSNAGSHPERSVPEPLSPDDKAQQEGSFREPLSPNNDILFEQFKCYLAKMEILARRRKSPRKDIFDKSASNEELAVNDATDNHPSENNETSKHPTDNNETDNHPSDNNETDNHPADNDEKEQPGITKSVDQPKEEEK